MSGNYGERKLCLHDYIHLAGTGKERKLARAPPALDFIEIGDPSLVPPKRIADAGMLYWHLFPNPDERTPWEDILKALSSVSRIGTDDEAKRAYSTRRYHVMLGLSGGDPVEFSMSCTLPFASDSVVAFGLYAGTASAGFMRLAYGRNDSFRGRSLQAGRYLIRHGIADEDAAAMGRGLGVVGTIAESEFIGQGVRREDIRFTLTRLENHKRNGLLPIMLRGKGGELITPMMQPMLSEGSRPLFLHLLYRPLRAGLDTFGVTEIDKDMVMELMRSYLHNYESGHYDRDHISEVRELVESRIRGARAALVVPPGQMPDIIGLAKMDPLLKEQLERDFGSMEEHEARVRDSFGL